MSEDSNVGQIRHCAQHGLMRLTLHAREEMTADSVSTDALVLGLTGDLVLLEDYPEDVRGHSHLLLCRLPDGDFLHVCCAMHESELVIITVYRPDEERWTPDRRNRR